MKFSARAGMVLGTSILLIATLAVPANAGLPVPPDVANLGLYLVDGSELGFGPSQVYGVGNPSDGRTWLMCKTDTDEFCLKATKTWAIDYLEVCKPTSTTSCISNVWAIDPNGKKIEGSVLKVVQDNPDQYIEANISNTLPSSHGMGAMWTFPGVVNSSGGNEFYVAVKETLYGDKQSGDRVSWAHYGPDNFEAGIIPVKEIPGNYGIRVGSDAAHGNGAWGAHSDGIDKAPDGTQCIVTDRTYCGLKAQFPADYRFGMTIKLGGKPKGWFGGRLGLPTITTTDEGKGEIISIEASPLLIPNLDFVVPNAQVPEAVKKMLFNGTEWGLGGNKTWQVMGETSENRIMDLLTAFTPAFGNKATNTESIWSLKTMVGDGGNTNALDRCSNSLTSFGGIVTSNALTYSAGPPSFDSQSGEMTYKVASPHFREDGTIARGSYDLAVRSDVVRCLYNFTSAPVRATISIQSEDGESQIATTVLSEKDGWLYLSAKGFTFSSPTIAVKFTQDAAPKPAPASKASTKKITITCTKGKSSKKVTAVKPTCPAGYKVK
jgi:hypothetical protein